MENARLGESRFRKIYSVARRPARVIAFGLLTALLAGCAGMGTMMLQSLHEGDNQGTQVRGDVSTYVDAAQKIFQDKGYVVDVEPNPRGPGGSEVGRIITATKTKQASVGDMAAGAVGSLALGALGVNGTHVRASSSVVYTVLINKMWDETTWAKEVPGECVITVSGAMCDTDVNGHEYNRQAVADEDCNAMASAIVRAGGAADAEGPGAPADAGPAPSDPLTYGMTLESQGRYDDAIQTFNNGIVADDQNVLLWRALGDLYFKLGRKSDAVATYEHVVQLRPQDQRFVDWFNAYKARP